MRRPARRATASPSGQTPERRQRVEYERERRSRSKYERAEAEARAAPADRGESKYVSTQYEP